MPFPTALCPPFFGAMMTSRYACLSMKDMPAMARPPFGSFDMPVYDVSNGLMMSSKPILARSTKPEPIWRKTSIVDSGMASKELVVHVW